MLASDLAAEADEATIAFQLVLAKMGAETIAEALTLWRRMNRRRMRQTANEFLRDATQMILQRREGARDLAVAYYRLARALRTGRTVPRPNERPPEHVTLAMLREEFSALTDPYLEPGEIERPDDSGLPPFDPDDDVDIDVDLIEVEPLEDLDLLPDALDADALDEAEVVLEALGPEGYERQLTRHQRRLERLRQAGDSDALDAEMEKMFQDSGLRQAAAAERLVMNGARSQVWEQARRDNRVIGYVRYSKTGTPCAWCAMLISRGLILYRSEESAGVVGDGNRYHDNCKCGAHPVYSRSHYNSSPLFNMNREYEKLWPQVTKGFYGKDALNAWRRYWYHIGRGRTHDESLRRARRDT